MAPLLGEVLCKPAVQAGDVGGMKRAKRDSIAIILSMRRAWRPPSNGVERKVSTIESASPSPVDLYDRMDVIPFEKLKRFFEEYLR